MNFDTHVSRPNQDKIMKISQLYVGVAVSLITAGNLLASTFTVDKAKSSVEVDVKATGDNFTATLNKYDVTVSGNASTLAPDKVVFKWDFADLATGKEDRDEKMISWLENKTKGQFVIQSLEKRNDGRHWAKGTMTIHGVDQVIEFPTKVLGKGENMTIRGTASIDTRKFNLPIIKMLKMFTVDPMVTVRFTLRGTVK